MQTEYPTPANPLEAREAFERDLAKVLSAREATLEGLNWERIGEFGLLVPVFGRAPGSQNLDNYLLKLGFGYYPKWPPSALFVNPVTKTYDPVTDKCWLPGTGSCEEYRVHNLHEHRPNNGPHYSGQLICSSVTLEFYLVRHEVKADQLWNPEKQNFGHTIAQTEWVLNSRFYTGRQSALY